MSNELNFSGLVSLVRKNLWTFIIVAAAAIAASAIFSAPFFIPPQFKSVAVVYPVNIEPLSEESETEQLLQFFQASSVRDSIIREYNLSQRFNIDTTESGWRFKVNKEYLDHVVVSKTNYESVRLEVFDENPKMAHAIATDVLNFVNMAANRLRNNNARQQARAYRKQIDEQRAMIDSMNTAISKFGAKHEVVHFQSQSREIMRGYFNTLLDRGADDRTLNRVHKLVEKVEANGPMYSSMVRLRELSQNQMNLLYNDYLKVKKEAEQKINYTMTVVEPHVPDKKSWPVRWLIVVISLIGAMLATLVVLLIIRKQDTRRA